VERVKGKIEAKLTLGDFALDDDKLTVPMSQEYAEEWLEQYVSIACKRSSQRIIRGIVHNYLLPDFGPRELNQTLRDWYISVAAAPRRRLHSVQQVYESAVSQFR
jgi:hypothetical protein